MEETASPAKNNTFLAGAIILAGLLIAGAIIYTRVEPKGGGNQPTDTAVAGNIAGDGHSLGNPDAPVVVVEFADFQCPFCEQFFKVAEPKIRSEYVKTGKVRLVYRHFAFLGPESERAAEASECANEQDRFWEYHDYLFGHQGAENSGTFSDEKLKAFARALNLDGSKFDACFDAAKYADRVTKDGDAGRDNGVTGTPTTFINGKALSGALPYAQFKAEIDKALGGK